VFWRTALGSSFGEPLWGATLARCPEQLSGTIALKNSSFRGQLYKQLRGAAFNSNFREQLSGAALQNSFGAVLGYRFEELQLWGNSFGQQLLVASLGRSF